MTNLWEKYKEELWWSILAMGAISGYLLSYLYFGQNLWIYFSCLAVAGIAVLKFPQVGLYLIFFCTLIFERHFTLQALAIGDVEYKLYPLDIIIGLTTLSVLLKLFFEHQEKNKIIFNKFDYPILVFGLVATASFIFALLTKVDTATAFGAYKNYFIYAIVYFLSLFILKTREDWKRLMFWFIFGSTIMFFFLGYGLLTGHGLWSEYTPLSTSGARLIAGTHAFYFVLFGFWSIAWFFWSSKENRLIGKKEMMFVLVLIALALVVSLVRHLWLALLMILILWLIYLPKSKKEILYGLFTKVLLFGILLSLLFFWIYGLKEGNSPVFVRKYLYVLQERVSISSVVNLQDESFRWRVSAWMAGVSLWRSSPFLGIGLGKQIIGYDELFFFDIPPRDLHNNYLGIFVQMGLLGIFAVIYWFIYLLKCLDKLWRDLCEKSDFDTILFFVWGNALVLFMIVFSISVYWDINLFIIWWWLGLAAVRFLAVEHKKI